jgi:hypothetical protein
VRKSSFWRCHIPSLIEFLPFPTPSAIDRPRSLQVPQTRLHQALCRLRHRSSPRVRKSSFWRCHIPSLIEFLPFPTPSAIARSRSFQFPEPARLRQARLLSCCSCSSPCMPIALEIHPVSICRRVRSVSAAAVCVPCARSGPCCATRVSASARPPPPARAAPAADPLRICHASKSIVSHRRRPSARCPPVAVAALPSPPRLAAANSNFKRSLPPPIQKSSRSLNARCCQCRLSPCSRLRLLAKL